MSASSSSGKPRRKSTTRGKSLAELAEYMPADKVAKIAKRRKLDFQRRKAKKFGLYMAKPKLSTAELRNQRFQKKFNSELAYQNTLAQRGYIDQLKVDVRNYNPARPYLEIGRSAMMIKPEEARKLYREHYDIHTGEVYLQPVGDRRTNRQRATGAERAIVTRRGQRSAKQVESAERLRARAAQIRADWEASGRVERYQDFARRYSGRM